MADTHGDICHMLVEVVGAVLSHPCQNPPCLIHKTLILHTNHRSRICASHDTQPSKDGGHAASKRTFGGAWCGLPSVTSRSMPSVPNPCSSAFACHFYIMDVGRRCKPMPSGLEDLLYVLVKIEDIEMLAVTAHDVPHQKVHSRKPSSS